MRGAWRIVLALVLAWGARAPVAAEEASPAWWSLALLDRYRTLWLATSDGAQRLRVLDGAVVTGVKWSPEGGRLAFTAVEDDRSVVGLITTRREPGVRVLGTGTLVTWSGDGRWLAWSDGERVVVADRDGNMVRTVEDRVNRLVGSPDGRWLGFTRPNGGVSAGPCPAAELGWIEVGTGAVTVQERAIGSFGWITPKGDAEHPWLVYTSADDARLRWVDPVSGKRGVLWSRPVDTCRAGLLVSGDGQWVGFLEAGSGGDDLVLLNLVSGEARRWDDLPVGYSGLQLPEAYLWLDPLARFVYASRSFPTEVTRIDLVTGAWATVASDPGILVGIAPEGERLAFVRNTAGKPPVLVLVEPATGSTVTLDGFGWSAWEPSPYRPLIFDAWQRTWEREDRPIAAGQVQRSWTWGPAPLRVTVEPYRDAPGGRRAVLYWDKARMEVTALSGERASRWYVTNGLLAKELITGSVQVGDAAFEQRQPAAIPVAGDADDPSGPTYATFQNLLSVAPLPVGSEIRWRLHRDGTTTDDGPGGVFVAAVVPETNHAVPDVFWEFLQSEGPVWVDGETAQGRLFEPLFFATGLPITEPYWATVKVGGEFRDVLVQCFERRCLTYTPSNPPGWRVEMGNVGQHYMAWRVQR
ncbi:MAG: peptidase domain-containing protein [Thermomicrobium sp.]|nr:peptidase domain-containing protein [Thermomicrobium sp.]